MPAAAPALSVLMPVHNGGRFLAEAISSILKQTFRDFEFLIVNDGSTDTTAQVLAGFSASDARIRITNLPHTGLVAALNHGFDLASGTWVARMDADDIAWPARLERQMAFASFATNTAAIGSFWRVIDADGLVRRTISTPTTPAGIAASLKHSNCLAHPTMLLRRAAVLACGGYRPAFEQAEDYDLWLRLSEHFEIHALPEVLLDYREHAGQSNWVKLEQRILSVRAAQYAAARRRAGEPDPFTQNSPIGWNALHSAGLPRAAIEAALIEGSLNAAKDALASGHGKAARAALRLLRQQKTLRRKTWLHGWVLGARSLLVRT